jgi:hypothetical protein
VSTWSTTIPLDTYQVCSRMFGALNRFIGRLDAEPSQQANTQNPGDNTFGFQVLRNTNTELALEPWFDFIIGLNGHFIVRAAKRLLLPC